MQVVSRSTAKVPDGGSTAGEAENSFLYLEEIHLIMSQATFPLCNMLDVLPNPEEQGLFLEGGRKGLAVGWEEKSRAGCKLANGSCL